LSSVNFSVVVAAVVVLGLFSVMVAQGLGLSGRGPATWRRRPLGRCPGEVTATYAFRLMGSCVAFAIAAVSQAVAVLILLTSLYILVKVAMVIELVAAGCWAVYIWRLPSD
jgi:hypothetical protein